MNKPPIASRVLALLTLSCLTHQPLASACTRVVYQGPKGTVITARSMDWKDDIPANLWVFPRGMERSGEVGPASVKWRAKYGSVATSSFDIATSDGMNEKGLVANMLWLTESKYPDVRQLSSKKALPSRSGSSTS